MQKFIQYLQAKNLSESTQKGYIIYVERFLKKRGENSVSATKKDILNYLSFLKNGKHQSSKSRYQSLIALKHYFNFLMDDDLVENNPTQFIKIRGVKRKFLYHIFNPEELTQLADNFYYTFIRNYDYNKTPQNRISTTKLSRERNRIIVQLLIHQGLITSEIAKITLPDLDLDKATIHIKGARRSNARTLQLKAEQIGAIIQYLHRTRPQFLDNYLEDSDQFFLLLPEKPNSKRPISYNYNNLFLKLTKELKKIAPDFLNFKQIRASVITNWIKTDGLRKAQYFAGHRYISTTENYKVNDLESLIGDIAKNHPLQ